MLAKNRYCSHFDTIADLVRTDFETAVSYFSKAIELQPSSEYGHVALIQTVNLLLRIAVEISADRTLAEFVKSPKHWWCLNAVSLAEQHIATLRERPQLKLSIRAQRVIAQWNMVYGNIQQVVAQLRILSQRYEDSSIRRALCDAIIAQYKRRWTEIPPRDLSTIVSSMQRNIEAQGVQDADVRNWLKAFRHLKYFDMEIAIERLIDWHGLRPSAVDPPFYLYVFYFVKWLNTLPRNAGYATESNRWLRICMQNRRIGQRGWSYEWLINRESKRDLIHFSDLTYDPVATLRGFTPEHKKSMSHLARVEGVVRDYRGPQQATLDLGQGLTLRFTPLTKITKDDEGKLASVLVSFSYDGPVGWDANLVEAK